MKWLNEPLLLSSCALGWHKRLICGFFKSNFFLKCSYVDFYLFSADAARKCSAESRASTCVWRPSSNGAARGTRRYAYLSTVSKKFFVALRGIWTLIAFSTFPFAIPFILSFNFIASHLECVAPRSRGNVDFSLIYCTDANYIFTLCLQQWQNTHTHTHLQDSEWDDFFFLQGFGYWQNMLLIRMSMSMSPLIPLTACCLSVFPFHFSFHVKSRQIDNTGCRFH